MQKNVLSEEVFLKEALHHAKQTERHLRNQIKLIEKRLTEIQKTVAVSVEHVA